VTLILADSFSMMSWITRGHDQHEPAA
jgi:hypothetical protein